MSAAQLASLITAIAGLVTAVTALIHSLRHTHAGAGPVTLPPVAGPASPASGGTHGD